MKASEVKQHGYYWAFAGGEWSIVHFSDGWFYYGDGSAESVQRLHHDYEVVGPLKAPNCPLDK